MVGWKKNQKEKKFFQKDVFPSGFPISGDKKRAKRGKIRNRWFLIFFVVSLPEKMIRKCFGGKEKE